MYDTMMVATRRCDYDAPGPITRSQTSPAGVASRLVSPVADPQRLGWPRQMRTHPDPDHYFKTTAEATRADAVGSIQDGSAAMHLVDGGAESNPLNQHDCQCNTFRTGTGDAGGAPSAPDDESGRLPAAVSASAPSVRPIGDGRPAGAVDFGTRALQPMSLATFNEHLPLFPRGSSDMYGAVQRRARKNPNPRHIPPGSRTPRTDADAGHIEEHAPPVLQGSSMGVPPNQDDQALYKSNESNAVAAPVAVVELVILPSVNTSSKDGEVSRAVGVLASEPLMPPSKANSRRLRLCRWKPPPCGRKPTSWNARFQLRRRRRIQQMGRCPRHPVLRLTRHAWTRHLYRRSCCMSRLPTVTLQATGAWMLRWRQTLPRTLGSVEGVWSLMTARYWHSHGQRPQGNNVDMASSVTLGMTIWRVVRWCTRLRV